MQVNIIPPASNLTQGAFLHLWKRGRHNNEADNIKTVFSMTKSGSAKINMLEIDGENIGFIATEVRPSDQYPRKMDFNKVRKVTLKVLFLFINADKRKSIFPGTEEDGGFTLAQYLLLYVVSRAEEFSRVVPLLAVNLQTASDKLIPVYEKIGFERLEGRDEGMMYLSLQ